MAGMFHTLINNLWRISECVIICSVVFVSRHVLCPLLFSVESNHPHLMATQIFISKKAYSFLL